MKAQVFLELVGKMMTAQGDYYASRKTEIKARQIELLIKSKDLEKLVRSVIKEGRLEADVDVPVLQMAVTAEEHQLVKDLALDLSGGDPTPAPPQNGEGVQAKLFMEDGNETHHG